MAIDPNLSDLFFNSDVTEAETHQQGRFNGYDDEKMRNAIGIAMCSAFGLYVSVGSDTLMLRRRTSRVARAARRRCRRRSAPAA